MSGERPPDDRRALLSSALQKLEQMQARLDLAERAQKEPVAIIGLGCRFPGGADSPDRYWELLRDGVDAIREIPAGRWNIEQFYDPNPDAPGKSYTRFGGFLDQIDRFDPQFFGISPREAVTLDPQQRLILEVAWEALEHAGMAPGRLRGTRTGVFIGIGSSDYAQLQMAGGAGTIDAYTGSGGGICFAAGRLSYCLGLQGPAACIDTACSSSLVAVHQACQSLRLSECRVALAGGVNVIAKPDLFVYLSRVKALAADGRSKVFDAAADGFVRAEGCGVVVLKQLSDAVADGDRVLAVIRGSAVNHDGPSSGLTVPNGPAQQAVITEALSRAGVAPAEVEFVETHGTGTSLGDPIETGALTAALRAGRAAGQTLTIASVKTNIGHLEAAAGIAGLIKVVLCLQHNEIPPHLHFHRLNPAISFGSMKVEIPTQRQPWLPGTRRRIAGVSAFGLSGTNAHVVMEEAPQARIQADTAADRPLHLLTLSARDEGALRELAGRYRSHLLAHPELGVADRCFTANTGRSHFNHRVAVVAPTAALMSERLAAIDDARVLAGSFEASSRPGIAFLFTGQGSQYDGMARTLYQSQATFRRAFDRVAEAVRGELERPLAEVLYGGRDGRALQDSTYAQPALFAIEYALAETWRGWGVEPLVVVGHSIGEYAAACVAGVLSVEAASKLVAARGRLMHSLPAGGAMAAVAAGATRVEAAIAHAGACEVAIAAVNAPESVVISGAEPALLAVMKMLDADGVHAQRLDVTNAFHSPLVDPILDTFESVAREIEYAAPRIPWISTLTGEPVLGAVDGAYWRRQIRGTVRFADAVSVLRSRGTDLAVEMGPVPVLTGLARQCGIDRPGWVGSLRKGRDDWEELLTALGTLYVNGAGVDWAGFDKDYPRRKLALPTYPFQRQRFWSQPRTAPASVPSACDGVHPLLSRRVRSPQLTAIVYETEIGTDTHPFLADHRVFGAMVFPAAGYFEMALAAARKTLGDDAVSLEDVEIGGALAIADGERTAVQIVVEPLAGGAAGFKVFSQPASASDSWHLHASGRSVRSGSAPAAAVDIEAVRARCQHPVEVAAHYEKVRGAGVEFGPDFRGVTQLAAGEGEAIGRIALPRNLQPDAAAYAIHPALLDAGLQVLGAAMVDEETYLPASLDSYRLSGAVPAQLWSHARLRPAVPASESLTADVSLIDDRGLVVASIGGLHLKRVPRGGTALGVADRSEGWFYHTAWRSAPLVESGHLPGAGTIAARVNSEVPALRDEYRIEEYKDLLPSLDALARAYLVQAFRRLGWALEPGERVTAGALADRLGVVDAHSSLLRRMLQMLEEQTILERKGDTWQVVRRAATEDPERVMERILLRFGDCRAELNLIGRCGRALAEALRGEADPLQLLFPDGSFAEGERLYQDSPFARLYNAAVARTVAAAIEGLPGDRKLRVLEVGGGTGGTTASVLRHLPPERTEYIFTDISPAFLAKAGQKFASFPFLRCQGLDIERSPQEQGFRTQEFDIVIAANVLHATSELRRTMKHIQSLLAPGGLTVMLEGTGPQDWVDLTFGLTPGWWRFTDRDLRPDYALLPARRWLELLRETGFAAAATVPDGTPGDGFSSRQAVIIAESSREAVARTRRGPWLVFGDRLGCGDEVSRILSSAGENVIRVASGAGYTRTRQGAEIDPCQPEHFDRLLSEVHTQYGNCGNVVHMWSLDAPAPSEEAPELLEHQQGKACQSALHLAQAMARRSEPLPPRLWLVTSGAQAAGETAELAMLQAPVWGLAKVIALEHPEFDCVRIDLDPAPGPGQARALAAELLAGSREDQIVLRRDRRLVARLVPGAGATAPRGGPALVFPPDGAYLITGGLSGLGLLAAKWMAHGGARHLVLMARSEVSPQAAQVIAAIEAKGVRVCKVHGDASRVADLAGAIAVAQADGKTLRGAILSAGVLDDGVLTEQTWSRFAAVMAPKVSGAWNLHVLTRALNLDFFVMFSSAAALLGSSGQSNHAAANAFLDALAHHRHAQGRPALSINWGVWSDVGAAARRHVAEKVAATGMGSISPKEGLRALERLMREGAVHAGVLPVQDWVKLLRDYASGSQPPFLNEIPRHTRATTSPAALFESDVMARMESAPAAERQRLLLQFVREQALNVLGLNASQHIDAGQPLNELGLDSLMAVELRHAISAGIKRPLPATLLFNYPSIDVLSRHLWRDVLALDAAAAPPAKSEDPGAEALDGLADDDLAAMFAEKLASLHGSEGGSNE